VSTDELRKIDAQIAALEAAEQQRILNKIASGEAVLLSRKPTVIGCPKPGNDGAAVAEVERDSQGRQIFYGSLTEDGRIDEGISLVVTGVPRAGRDDDGEAISSPPPKSRGDDWLCSMCGNRYPSNVTVHHCVPRDEGPKGPKPRSAAIQSEAAWHSLVVQVQAPSEANPGGSIREYRYQVAFGTVRVAELDGRVIGSAAVAPSDDVRIAARKIIRECSTGFNSPLLNYPHLTIV
jgi:hypothetical protein